MADQDDTNHEREDPPQRNRMDFIVHRHARIEASLELVVERLNQLAARDTFTPAQQDGLTADVASLVQWLESFKGGIRGALQNLIVANEATRDLTKEVARLALKTGQRASHLEEG